MAKLRLVVVGNEMAGARAVEEVLLRGGGDQFDIVIRRSLRTQYGTRRPSWGRPTAICRKAAAMSACGTTPKRPVWGPQR
jgi:hypothetical protein